MRDGEDVAITGANDDEDAGAISTLLRELEKVSQWRFAANNLLAIVPKSHDNLPYISLRLQVVVVQSCRRSRVDFLRAI